MRFEFIEHQALSYKIIEAIICLKDKVWHYSFSSHLEWLKNNIRKGDIHLLLWNKEDLIGYLNLIRLHGSIEAWGIGNVVVDPTMQGCNLGLLLLNLCDYYLADTKLPGVLICKNRVKAFYSRCGWKEFMKDVYINGEIVPYCFFSRRLDTTNINIIKLDRSF